MGAQARGASAHRGGVILPSFPVGAKYRGFFRFSSRDANRRVRDPGAQMTRGTGDCFAVMLTWHMSMHTLPRQPGLPVGHPYVGYYWRIGSNPTNSNTSFGDRKIKFENFPKTHVCGWWAKRTVGTGTRYQTIDAHDLTACMRAGLCGAAAALSGRPAGGFRASTAVLSAAYPSTAPGPCSSAAAAAPGGARGGASG
eukprot:gene3010-biopygen3619